MTIEKIRNKKVKEIIEETDLKIIYDEEKENRKIDFDDEITPNNKPLIDWIFNIRNELFKQAEAIKELNKEFYGEN